MSPQTQHFREQVQADVAAILPEYLPYLAQMVRTFRETVGLKPADASFRQGWREARSGNTHPVSGLWEGIDAE